MTNPTPGSRREGSKAAPEGSFGDDRRDAHDAEPRRQPSGPRVRPQRRSTDAATGGPAPAPTDRALALLLFAAERDVRVGLTVHTGGIVVTGTLVGTLAYFRALADHFASVAGGTNMDEIFADAFRDLVDEAAEVAHGDRRTPPDDESFARSLPFLHLADARFVSSNGLLPNGRHGVLWRCRVAEITSWSLGGLTSP